MSNHLSTLGLFEKESTAGMMIVATARAVELSVEDQPSVVVPMSLVPTPQKNIAGAPRINDISERLAIDRRDYLRRIDADRTDPP